MQESVPSCAAAIATACKCNEGTPKPMEDPKPYKGYTGQSTCGAAAAVTMACEG